MSVAVAASAANSFRCNDFLRNKKRVEMLSTAARENFLSIFFRFSLYIEALIWIRVLAAAFEETRLFPFCMRNIQLLIRDMSISA